MIGNFMEDLIKPFSEYLEKYQNKVQIFVDRYATKTNQRFILLK